MPYLSRWHKSAKRYLISRIGGLVTGQTVDGRAREVKNGSKILLEDLV